MLHDLHSDANVLSRHLSDETQADLDAMHDDLRCEAEAEMSFDEIEHCATRGHAMRYKLNLYRLRCAGFPNAYEAAMSDRGAYRKAISRGWARGGGVVHVDLLDSFVPPHQQSVTTKAC